MGADMVYTCLGNGKYKIEAKVYRDCRGASLGSISLKAFAGNNGSNNCGTVNLGNMTVVDIRDVSTQCSTATNPCGSPNTARVQKGIEEHTLELIVDFNESPLSQFYQNSSCCEITFFIEQCCRNNGITTGPSGDGFATTCMINLCNIRQCGDECNSSPILSSTPVGFLCCNIPWYYNNGAFDTIDYDSLKYSLVPGLQNAPSTQVSYNNPFSAQMPLTPYCPGVGNSSCTPKPYNNPPEGFYFDTVTGDIIVQPVDCNEVPLIVIEQKEFRQDTNGNWVVVGITRRDMQLWIQNCGYNNPPVINGPFYFEVCEGDEICQKIKISDTTFSPNQIVPDTVLGSWNGGIPGATFSVVDSSLREKEYEFCWQTDIGQARQSPYTFIVRATDQHCSPPMTSIRSFQIRVLPKIEVQMQFDTVGCGDLKVDNYWVSGPSDSLEYKWEFRDSTGLNLLGSSTNKTDTFRIKNGGKYIVRLKVSRKNGCEVSYSDTIEMPQPKIGDVISDDFEICKNQSLGISPLIKTNDSNYSISWVGYFPVVTNGSLELINPGNSAEFIDSFFFNNLQNDTAVLFTLDFGNDCIFRDTVIIQVNELPNIELGPNITICWFENTEIGDADVTDYQYLWNTGDTTASIEINSASQYILEVTDSNMCKNRDSMELLVLNEFTVSAGSDIEICPNLPLILNGSFTANNSDSISVKWINILNDSILIDSNELYLELNNPNGEEGADFTYSFDYRVIAYLDTKSCLIADTVNVIVHSTPKLNWVNPLPSQCFEFGDIILNPYLNTGAITNPQIWSGSLLNHNQMVDSILPDRHLFKTGTIDNEQLQSGQNKSFSIYAKTISEFGCVAIDSTIQTILGSPIIELIPKEYCQNQGEASLENNILKPASKTGISWQWNQIEIPNDVNGETVIEDRNPNGTPDWFFIFGNSDENQFQGDYQLEYCVTDLLSQCKSCDTIVNKVVAEPTITISTDIVHCVNTGFVDLEELIIIDTITQQAVSDGIFDLYSVNSDTNDIRTTQPLIDNHILPTGWGVGIYLFKYSIINNGCRSSEEFNIFVQDTPNIEVQSKLWVCSEVSEINLDSLINYNTIYPSNGIINWSGNSIVNSIYSVISPQIQTIENSDSLLLQYSNQHGCIDSEWVEIIIRNQPQLTITTPSPTFTCTNEKVLLNSNSQWCDTSLIWTTSGDGLFDNSKDKITSYTTGEQDINNGVVKIFLHSLPLLNDVCPPVNDSIEVKIVKSPILTSIDSFEGCVPLQVNWNCEESSGLDADSLSYLWNFSSGWVSSEKNPEMVYSVQGRYPVTLIALHQNNGHTCTSTVSESVVKAYPIPQVYFDSDPYYGTTLKDPEVEFINQTMIFENPFNPELSYYWDFGTGLNMGYSRDENPTFENWPDTGYFEITLFAISEHGCEDSFKREIYIGPDTTILYVYVPDAFTPDQSGPGTNEKFTPVVTQSKTYDLKIFNRWGEKLFESYKPGEGWDGTDSSGTPVPAGVYIFQLHITDYDNEPYVYGGTITLLK